MIWSCTTVADMKKIHDFAVLGFEMDCVVIIFLKNIDRQQIITRQWNEFVLMKDDYNEKRKK